MPSVVIPAHNEEAVIGRTLQALLAGAPPGALEVIVVANGCTDQTAAVAAGFGPDVRVIELPQASKHAALNAGTAAATRFPRAFVDADVDVSWRAIDAVAKAFAESDVLVGAPTLQLDLTSCPWYVRSFCRVWLSQPWMTDAPVGTGVYVLTEKGHARLGQFPNITNDDQYVHDLFTPSERRCVAGWHFVVRVPRTFRGLVARRTRTMAGAIELESRFGRLPGRAPRRGFFGIVRHSPRLLFDLPVFIAVTVLARRAALHKTRTRHGRWERDESSRLPSRTVS